MPRGTKRPREATSAERNQSDKASTVQILRGLLTPTDVGYIPNSQEKIARLQCGPDTPFAVSLGGGIFYQPVPRLTITVPPSTPAFLAAAAEQSLGSSESHASFFDLKPRTLQPLSTNQAGIQLHSK